MHNVSPPPPPALYRLKSNNNFSFSSTRTKQELLQTLLQYESSSIFIASATMGAPSRCSTNYSKLKGLNHTATNKRLLESDRCCSMTPRFLQVYLAWFPKCTATLSLSSAPDMFSLAPRCPLATRVTSPRLAGQQWKAGWQWDSRQMAHPRLEFNRRGNKTCTLK